MGVGGRVRWELAEVGEVCVVMLGSVRRRGRCGKGVLVVVCMTSVMSLCWKTFRVCVRYWRSLVSRRLVGVKGGGGGEGLREWGWVVGALVKVVEVKPGDM